MAVSPAPPAASRGSRVTLAVHTPGVTPPEQLRDFTVGRESELQVLRDSLQAAATSDNRNHILVQGPRGSGKTHLLTLAAHLARTDPDLSSRLLVAQLPEDAYRVTDYSELLAETVEASGSSPSSRDVRELEQQLMELAGGRVVVVIVENLHRLFGLLGEQGQRSLRAFVQNSGRVLLLGSTPSLVEDLGDHGMPFYGFFNSVRLADLASEQGRELLLRLAELDGDERLSSFLASGTGLDRLRAVAALTGGSPRLWLLLAGCMTVERLDEVVPLFVEVLDKLGPYYKARLEELSPDRAKLVSHLCTARGPDGRTALVGARTVKELAADTGMTQQTASKQLAELQRLGYVVAEKAQGSDQRSTFYRVREPMLAHWLAMKERQSEPLEVVVRMLRAWYATPDLRSALARAPAGSVSEAHLGAALGVDAGLGGQARMVELVDASSVDDLLVETRRVLADPAQANGMLTSPNAATLAEALALTVRQGRPSAETAARNRLPLIDPALRDALSEVLGTAVEAAAAALPGAGSEHGRPSSLAETGAVSRGLEAAADQGPGMLPDDDTALLGILAANWAHRDQRTGPALRRLRELSERGLRLSERMRLYALAELSFLQWEDGDHDNALQRGRACLNERVSVLGDDHPDTLASRLYLAKWVGESGEAARARELLADLAQDHLRVLGRDHLQTISCVASQAYWTARSGDAAGARDISATLVADARRALGPDHAVTIAIRHNHADFTGEAGDAATARDLLADLIDPAARTFGPSHSKALTVRHAHATWTGRAGDPAMARDLSARLVADATRALGSDHEETLAVRYNHAQWIAEAGEHTSAAELLQSVIDDATRAFGPDDSRTLTARRMLARLQIDGGDITAIVTAVLRLIEEGSSLPEDERDRHEDEAWHLLGHAASDLLRARREDPAAATGQLREFLSVEADEFKSYLAVGLTAGELSDDEALWLIDEFDAAEQAPELVIAVLGHVHFSQPDDETLSLIQRWEQLASKRGHVLAPLLAAVRTAVFEDSRELLIRLPQPVRAVAQDTIDGLSRAAATD